MGRMGDTTRKFRDQLGTLLVRQCLKFLKKLSGRLRHETSVR